MRTIFFSNIDALYGDREFTASLRLAYLLSDSITVAGEYAAKMQYDSLLKKLDLKQKIAVLEKYATVHNHSQLLEVIADIKQNLISSIEHRKNSNLVFIASKKLENSFMQMFKKLYPFFITRNENLGLDKMIPFVNENFITLSLFEYSIIGGCYLKKDPKKTANKLIELYFPVKKDAKHSVIFLADDGTKTDHSEKIVIKKWESKAIDIEVGTNGESISLYYGFKMPGFMLLTSAEMKQLKLQLHHRLQKVLPNHNLVDKHNVRHRDANHQHEILHMNPCQHIE